MKRMARKKRRRPSRSAERISWSDRALQQSGHIPATTFQCPTDEDGKAKLALELDLPCVRKLLQDGRATRPARSRSSTPFSHHVP